jgi:hypothetical protein
MRRWRQLIKHFQLIAGPVAFAFALAQSIPHSRALALARNTNR